MGASPSTTFDPVQDLPNLYGKVVIVSTGIGFAYLQHLSSMGAKVYMTVPDEDTPREALERVEEEGREPGLGEAIRHELDLKDPLSTKDQQSVISRESRLDILINNAAQITDLGNPQMNVDGIQNNAICYLCPFVFTRTLLPLLESTASLEGADVTYE
ncbi:hypothetical protein F5146DRAFT_384723 [Armillaria mellea]|nr:hypothetical protein F5146DRAFT_384723 [Armillaria mellea]